MYAGDILSIYAVFGIIMLFLNRFKNWVLILIAVLLLAGAPRLVMIGYIQLTAPPATEQVVSNENRPQRPRPNAEPQERPKPTFLLRNLCGVPCGTEEFHQHRL